MGHQIRSAGEAINWTSGANLICHWCEAAKLMLESPQRLRADDDFEAVGVTNITPDVIAQADKIVPRDYDEAVKAGWDRVHPQQEVGMDRDRFDKCRSFLAYAAAQGEHIHGSW